MTTGKALAQNLRDHLVEIYKQGGYRASKPVAISMGISPNTVLKYVRAVGAKPPGGRDNRGGHNRKIAKEQREDILRVFLAEGAAAAIALATSHGLSPRYPYKLASERGYAYFYPRPPGKPRPAKIPRAPRPAPVPSRKYNYWTNHEVQRLHECFPIMSREELAIEFPRHSIGSIVHMARRRLRIQSMWSSRRMIDSIQAAA